MLCALHLPSRCWCRERKTPGKRFCLFVFFKSLGLGVLNWNYWGRKTNKWKPGLRSGFLNFFESLPLEILARINLPGNTLHPHPSFGCRWENRERYLQAAVKTLDVPSHSILELILPNRRVPFSKTESNHIYFQNKLGHGAVSQVPQSDD